MSLILNITSGVGAVGAVGARAHPTFEVWGNAPPTFNLQVKLFYSLLREVAT